MVLFLQNNEVDTLRKSTKKIHEENRIAKIYFSLKFFTIYLPGVSGFIANQDKEYSVRVRSIALKNRIGLSL